MSFFMSSFSAYKMQQDQCHTETAIYLNTLFWTMIAVGVNTFWTMIAVGVNTFWTMIAVGVNTFDKVLLTYLTAENELSFFKVTN